MRLNIKSLTLLLLAQAVIITSCRKNNTGFGSEGQVNYDSTTPLKEAADFPIGVAVSYTPLLNDAKYVATIKRDFDAVTFDYNMKHGAMVQDNGTIDFSRSDAMIAALSGVDIFGHTLGWHQNQNANYLKAYAGLVAISGEWLTNGGFETGLGTWNIWNTGNPTGSSTVTTGTDAHTGTGSMKVVNPTAYPGNQWRVQVASPLFNTVVGRQYVISYWVKAATAGGSIRLSTQDASNGNSQYQGDQNIGTAWQQIVWTITANSPQTRFLFDMGQAANTYYIDDASFKEILPPSTGPQVAAKVDTALNNYITAVVNHFKGKVKAWDVVNEVLADDGTLRNNSNTTQANDVFVWSHYMGKDYVLNAFKYAKAADPNALLFINDYGFEYSPAKLDAMIALVNEMKGKGAKIDGIGTQMHMNVNTPYANIDNMFQKLAATGLLVRVSELDISTGSTTAGPQDMPSQIMQAVMYKYVVSSYMRNVPPAQRAGITVWGLSDNYSWLYKNDLEHPLLYDKNYNRKPAYTAFLQALKGK